MTRKHHRLGSWVRSYQKADGTYVHSHPRSGTTVSDHETPEHLINRPWKIDSAGRKLAYNTICWWCDEPVFFYRNEYGGCALFDMLGWPWPIHSCWGGKIRGIVLGHIEESLEESGYDGHCVKTIGQIPTPGFHGDRISLRGYISQNYKLNSDYEPTILRGCKRSSFQAIAAIEIFDESGFIFNVWVPENVAENLNNYDLIKATAIWVTRKKWNYLLINSIQTMDENFNTVDRYRCFQSTSTCRYCSRDIGSAEIWGIDIDGKLECESCCDMRGPRTSTDFIQACRKIGG